MKKIFLILAVISLFIVSTNLIRAEFIEKNISIKLDGNSSVKVSDSEALDGFSQATWNIWIKQNAYTDKAGIIGKYSARAGKRSYLIRTTLNNSISLALSADGITSETETSASKRECGIRNENEWTMITITYNGSLINYYRNGIRCSFDETTISQLYNSNEDLSFGYGNKVYFSGLVDDVKIYNSELGRQQVVRLYDESIHGKYLGQSVTAILYHQIDENATSSDKVTPENFRQQMQFIKDSGFTFITTEDYYNWKNGNFDMPEKSAIIIFDDGWKSVHTYALSIMNEVNGKANVAVVTNYANGFSGNNYMSWSQLEELKNNGWGILSHSLNHTNMLALDEQQFRIELNESKKIIQTNLNLTPESYVFPYHKANETYTSICGEYYELCWTRGEKATVPRYNYKSTDGKAYGWLNPYTGLKRITISNATTLEEFKEIFARHNNIIGEWRMEEGQGETTQDSSGNSNHAQLLNNAQWHFE